MSNKPKKGADGYIVNPLDSEDFAYNIARSHKFSYQTQVELEATLNELSYAVRVVDRAMIVSNLLYELEKVSEEKEDDHARTLIERDHWEYECKKQKDVVSALGVLILFCSTGWLLFLLSMC